jgi:hypothetical protein
MIAGANNQTGIKNISTNFGKEKIFYKFCGMLELNWIQASSTMWHCNHEVKPLKKPVETGLPLIQYYDETRSNQIDYKIIILITYFYKKIFMHAQKENIKKAIGIIRDTQEEIHELLAGSPDLQVRANNALERLANGFAHLAGELMRMSDTVKATGQREPLTHIAGVKIKQPKSKPVKDATPSKEEQEEFDGFIDDAYEEFRNADAKIILANNNDLVIRAVAKRAGINPANVDIAFVEKIKAAILKKDDFQKAQIANEDKI